MDAPLVFAEDGVPNFRREAKGMFRWLRGHKTMVEPLDAAAPVVFSLGSKLGWGRTGTRSLRRFLVSQLKKNRMHSARSWEKTRTKVA